MAKHFSPAHSNSILLARCLQSLAFIFSLLLVNLAWAAENGDIPRTADGRPDFNGIWQAINTAHYDIEPHAADFSPVVEMGAIGAIPAGLGIVEGGEIPYTAEARAKQLEKLC